MSENTLCIGLGTIGFFFTDFTGTNIILISLSTCRRPVNGMLLTHGGHILLSFMLLSVCWVSSLHTPHCSRIPVLLSRINKSPSDRNPSKTSTRTALIKNLPSYGYLPNIQKHANTPQLLPKLRARCAQNRYHFGVYRVGLAIERDFVMCFVPLPLALGSL